VSTATEPDRETAVRRYHLDPAERAVLHLVVDDLTTRYERPEDPRFLRRVATAAAGLPLGLREFVEAARLDDCPVFAVRGFTVDDDALGPTPDHWANREEKAGRREDFALVLLASLLGDVYSMEVLPGGQLVNDVIPMLGQESAVTAGSSQQTLEWHTEEAGFDVRPRISRGLRSRVDSRVVESDDEDRQHRLSLIC